ncbi:MAG: hypothetical protein GPJ07_08200 [Microcystis aeruginosa G13-07]|nr:hypothetical protein [Microcystis aeruginosa G13-07]
MNPSQLKYGEIFCFLTLFFLILFLFLSNKQDSQKALEEASAKLPLKDLPPNITIQNTGQFAFPLGQANLTTKLESYIAGEIVSKIKNYFQKYDVNTIEVIGHTDGLEVSGNSNLDKLLNTVATENKKIIELRAGSNTDLGLMRALAVIKELQNEEQLLQVFKNKGIDKDKVFRAYSAAQLYLPSGKIAPPDPQANQERRRIEIRFTKLNYEDKTKE